MPLVTIPSTEYAEAVTWNVEYTDAFGDWWQVLKERQQEDVTSTVLQLIDLGPQLPYPHSSAIVGSRHGHMREMRVQSGGQPLRILYASDPRRSAILLIGGDKTGDKRFYDRMVPLADGLYDVYLLELKREGLIP